MARWTIKCLEPRNVWVIPLRQTWRFVRDGDLETDDPKVVEWAKARDGFEIIDNAAPVKDENVEEKPAVSSKKSKKSKRGGK